MLREGEGELVLDGFRVSIWEGGKFLEVDSGDDSTMM